MDGNRSDQVTLPLPGIHRIPARERLSGPHSIHYLRRRPAGVLFSTERNESNNKIKSCHEPTSARRFFGKISREFNTTPAAGRGSNIEWFVLLRFTLPRNNGRLKRPSSGKLTRGCWPAQINDGWVDWRLWTDKSQTCGTNSGNLGSPRLSIDLIEISRFNSTEAGFLEVALR